MSGVALAPGPKSLQGLAWLARVGASPVEPLGLVMGWNRTLVYDHARRLASDGLVARVRMTRGDGSLIVMTPAGAVVAGRPASSAPRSLAPTTWAHTCACAWTSAWLQLRLQTAHAFSEQEAQARWFSEREIAADRFWRRTITYQDRRGTVSAGHRPDLGLRIGDRPAAVEVELQRKVRARLAAILSMYAQQTRGAHAPLEGLIYVSASADITAAIGQAAKQVGLLEGQYIVRSLRDVVAQTRQAAAQRDRDRERQ